MPEENNDNLPKQNNEPKGFNWEAVIIGIICLVLTIMLLQGCAGAYTLDQWADAIHHAEGNDNYGILAHYKHTSYRQACKNTVWHRWCIYKNKGLKTGFTAFLGASYCPIGALNDPDGLNINWVHNVTYYLMKGE